MALPVFNYGNFEITSLAFSPAVIAIGEATSFSVALKNTSGVNISKCFVRAGFTIPVNDETEETFADYISVILYGNATDDRSAIAWANGEVHTFSGSFVFPTLSSIDRRRYILRDVRMSMIVVTDEALGHGGNSDFINHTTAPELNEDGYLTVLSKRDNPTLYFEAERYPTDESAAVSASIRLSGDTDAETLLAHGYAAALYKGAEASGSADTGISINCTIEEIIAGVESSPYAIAEEFPNTGGWLLKLEVSNGYESTFAIVSVSRAFANMHLSGKSTGGVAFGGFSTSEEGEPKAEFHYKIYPYAGIEGLGITYPQPNSDYTDYTTGEEQLTGDYWIDGKPIYRRVGEGYIGATNNDIAFQHIPDVDSVVKLYGYAKPDGDLGWIPINMYINSAWKFNVFIKKYGDNNTQMVAQTAGTNARVYAVLEFTKPD